MTTLTHEPQSASHSKSTAWIIRHSLPIYFLLAFLGSWLAIAPLALSRQGAGILSYDLPDAAFFLIYIGAAYIGPALAAFLLTALESGKTGVRKLFGSIFKWRVGLRWYLIALFSFLLIWLVAYNLVFQGIPLASLISNWQLLFSVFIPWIFLGILIPSLGEEPGWRGYALPRLQARYSPLLGTLVLGLLHGLWHLPAFFTPMLGPFTVSRYAAFLLTAVAGTFIYTWVFNGTRGSIFLVILLHSASNAASMYLSQIIPVDAQPASWAQNLSPDWLNMIAFTSAALLLVILTKGRLAYSTRDNS
jgi:uncharacterized protein